MFLIDDIMIAAMAEAAAAEAAVATTAEVAAAEAIAAETLAAQQAAAQAAATQAAAQQTAQAGIMGLEGATASQPLTAEAVQNAAMNSGQNFAQGLPPGFEQQLQNIQGMSQGPSVQMASANPGAGIQGLQGSTAQELNTAAQQQAANLVPPPPPVAPPPTPMGIEGQIPADQFIEAGSGGINSFPNTMANANLDALAKPSALENGMKTAMKFAKEYPLPTMMGTYMGANALGLFKPSGATFNAEKYDGPLSRYRLSPDFKGSTVNPASFRYTPRYAEGGIMGDGFYNAPAIEDSDVPEYAKGGTLPDSIERYQKMLEGRPQAAPAVSRDVGIYHDTDPDTRYQDALTAAQIRQAKVNKRAYVSPPVAKRPTPMGQLQMASVKPRKQSGDDDVEAAQGGIMHSSLGGYAAGGNPRLLKGPGDGMSDNIPATINGRQPARLADGEFVIPADVVSHLGNGSTEAGAKQLHAMMNKIRKARTGNPKQGKQINPSKFLPK